MRFAGCERKVVRVARLLDHAQRLRRAAGRDRPQLVALVGRRRIASTRRITSVCASRLTVATNAGVLAAVSAPPRTGAARRMAPCGPRSPQRSAAAAAIAASPAVDSPAADRRAKRSHRLGASTTTAGAAMRALMRWNSPRGGATGGAHRRAAAGAPPRQRPRHGTHGSERRRASAASRSDALSVPSTYSAGERRPFRRGRWRHSPRHSFSAMSDAAEHRLHGRHRMVEPGSEIVPAPAVAVGEDHHRPAVGGRPCMQPASERERQRVALGGGRRQPLARSHRRRRTRGTRGPRRGAARRWRRGARSWSSTPSARRSPAS